jgi:hypothetical protein
MGYWLLAKHTGVANCSQPSPTAPILRPLTLEVLSYSGRALPIATSQ